MQPEEVAGLASASGATVIIVGTWHTRTAWRHSRKRSVSEEGTQLRAVGFAASCEEHHLAPCCPVSNTRANGCGGNASGGYGSQAVPLALRGAWQVSQAQPSPCCVVESPVPSRTTRATQIGSATTVYVDYLGRPGAPDPAPAPAPAPAGLSLTPPAGLGFRAFLAAFAAAAALALASSISFCVSGVSAVIT